MVGHVPGPPDTAVRSGAPSDSSVHRLCESSLLPPIQIYNEGCFPHAAYSSLCKSSWMGVSGGSGYPLVPTRALALLLLLFVWPFTLGVPTSHPTQSAAIIPQYDGAVPHLGILGAQLAAN